MNLISITDVLICLFCAQTYYITRIKDNNTIYLIVKKNLSNNFKVNFRSRRYHIGKIYKRFDKSS